MWDSYEIALERSQRSAAYREVAVWALTELRLVLGEDWLRRAAESERPPPLLAHLDLVGWHTLAFADVVEWALRLRLVRDVPGEAKLRRDLTCDATAGRTLHTALQLGVATMALRLGWDVALEPRAADGPPADVLVAAPAGELLTETRVRSAADITQRAHREVDEVMHRLVLLGAKHGASIEGRLERVPSESELHDIERRVADWTASEPAATRWSADGIDLRIVARDRAQGQLMSPPIRTDTWMRLTDALNEKAARMERSGAQWLRILPLTGMWAFTPWARRPLESKLRDVAAALKQTLGDAGPAGVVLSSSATLHPGDVPESTVVAGSAIGVRRAIAPMRARETLIVPLDRAAEPSADDWAALADAEADWLDWALTREGLPSLAEVLAE